jgi:hypothetical protein
MIVMMIGMTAIIGKDGHKLESEYIYQQATPHSFVVVLNRL